MKKGKITLISFEEEEEEIEIQRKQPETTKVVKSNLKAPSFDFSQIKDRVSQMELDEEIILEGAEAEAFEEQEDEETYSGAIETNLRFTENDINRIKEQRKVKFEEKFGGREDDEMLPDFVPITSKSEYWQNQDTRDSENNFQLSSNSRLVREDLFNEKEVDDASGSFTSFIGKSGDGQRSGLMMTSKMLERDIKSQNYDLDLDVNITENGSDSNEEENEENLVWEQAQMLKGMEKGWDQSTVMATSTTTTTATAMPSMESFLIKQTKLNTFISPPKLTRNYLDKCDAEIPNKIVEIEENIQKIEIDSEKIEGKRRELEIEIGAHERNLKNILELEKFFVRYTRFLREKMEELDEIDTFDRWEHFFDHLDDDDDDDLIDLPEILNKLKSLNMAANPRIIKESTELFIKYHFKSAFNYGKDFQQVWDESGLKQVLTDYFEGSDGLLIGLFEDIYGVDLVEEKFKFLKE